MSSDREPMWYCHECRAEMRPLMTPDPHCASCHGTFLEKLDNPQDDPRTLQNAAGAAFFDDDEPFSMFAPFFGLRGFGPSRNGSTSPTHPPSASTMRFEFNGPGTHRVISVGGRNVLNRRNSETGRPDSSPTRASEAPPNLSEFVRANSSRPSATGQQTTDIPGELMLQYLMALLGSGPGGGFGSRSPFFGPLGEGTGLGNGRMGDYVFTQDALDQILTQLMEGGSSTRPVPATQQIMDDLPRIVLEEGSKLLEKDCAVCKEQFDPKAEDPTEQVVVTLPCDHTFHEGCILPWLKSSGTCPVCRHALVPQPTAHSPGGPSGSSSSPNNGDSADSRPSDGGNSNGGNSRSRGSGGSGTSSHGQGLLSSLFSSLAHPIHGGPSQNRRRESSHSPNRQRRPSRDTFPPGAWRD